MIRISALLFSLLLSSQISSGQTFVVVEAKGSFHLNGAKIRKGDTLNIQSKFLIKKKGQLKFVHSNQWGFIYAAPMKYKLDTLFTKIAATKEFIIHDSIFNVLRSANIHRCDFPYKLICTPILGGFTTSYADDIKSEHSHRIETAEPSIKLKWNYPADYKGTYYVLITTLFDDYIDLKTAQENSIELNLLGYKRHRAILYKVISEECRESDLNAIIMK
jgi:hypothetical protein